VSAIFGESGSAKDVRRKNYRIAQAGGCSMQIEGSVRTNLLAAIAGARRWKGRQVHEDTIEHWRRLLDYGRLIHRQPCGEAVGDLVAELEIELAHIERRDRSTG
jgi:hypothetical protein